MIRFAPLLLLPTLLSACPADEPPPTPVPDYTYTEQDDANNDSPFTPEAVETDWDPTLNRTLTLKGTLESCAYEPSGGGWPWTGDEDDFAVTIPATGILLMETAWDGGDGDLDWIWWRDVPETGPTGGTATPTHQIDGSGSDMNYDFDDEQFEADHVMVFTFLCKSGAGGDYSMRLDWEE